MPRVAGRKACGSDARTMSPRSRSRRSMHASSGRCSPVHRITNPLPEATMFPPGDCDDAALMGNRSDRRPKSLVTRQVRHRDRGANEDRAHGCSIRVSAQHQHAARKDRMQSRPTCPQRPRLQSMGRPYSRVRPHFGGHAEMLRRRPCSVPCATIVLCTVRL